MNNTIKILGGAITGAVAMAGVSMLNADTVSKVDSDTIKVTETTQQTYDIADIVKNIRIASSTLAYLNKQCDVQNIKLSAQLSNLLNLQAKAANVGVIASTTE